MENLSWIFDDSPIPDPFGKGEDAVRFLRLLRHPKSNLPGYAFELNYWQERIVRMIYGPCHLADVIDERGSIVFRKGDRIARTVVIMLPRGNRKTSLGAALALLHTIGPESIAGGQCISAGYDRRQARVSYEEATAIIEAGGWSDRLHLVSSKNRIRNKLKGSFFEAMSADGHAMHGHTPVFALCDEIHLWKDRELWNAIRSGLRKSKNSLQIIISTAGRGDQNLASEVFEDARKVQRGEINRPSLLPILFELPKDADWLDEDNWYLVNPGLKHGYPDIGGFRDDARTAMDVPAARAEFQQYALNIWQDGSASPFVDMLIYDEGKAPFDLEDMEGLPCWLGVDLGRTSDLSVVVAAWRDDNTIYVWAWFFCPADNLRKREDKDKVPYVQWADEGYIIPTGGTVTDYRAIEDQIRELYARFEVREIAFDPKYGSEVMRNLMEDDVPVVEFPQSWATMAPAVKELERVILGRLFRHGGHPILRWNFENIVVVTDRNGNVAFNKGKSREKIDGAVATAMAVSRALAGENGASFYDTFDGDFDQLLEDMYA